MDTSSERPSLTLRLGSIPLDMCSNSRLPSDFQLSLTHQGPLLTHLPLHWQHLALRLATNTMTQGTSFHLGDDVIWRGLVNYLAMQSRHIFVFYFILLIITVIRRKRRTSVREGMAKMRKETFGDAGNVQSWLWWRFHSVDMIQMLSNYIIFNYVQFILCQLYLKRTSVPKVDSSDGCTILKIY